MDAKSEGIVVSSVLNPRIILVKFFFWFISDTNVIMKLIY